MLAIAEGQSPGILTVPSPSRAGSLPLFLGWLQDSHPPQIPCWSGLARDSGVSATGVFDRAVAIASRLAPTVFSGWPQDSHPPQIPCGSEPARDSGVSVTGDFDCAAAIASRRAPTVFRGGCKIHIHRRSPVGASLLAIAVLFDDVDLAYINAAVPGAGCIQGDEYGIAGVDRQVVSVGCLQGDAAFDQVHQFMQLVRPGPAGVRR